MKAKNPFAGSWTYRSMLNDPDVNKKFNDLEFGRGTIPAGVVASFYAVREG